VNSYTIVLLHYVEMDFKLNFFSFFFCEHVFTGDLLFFGCTLVIYIVFTHLAREWPKIMAKWELMEREIKQFERPHNIALKFKILTSIVVLLSTST